MRKIDSSDGSCIHDTLSNFRYGLLEKDVDKCCDFAVCDEADGAPVRTRCYYATHGALSPLAFHGVYYRSNNSCCSATRVDRSRVIAG